MTAPAFNVVAGRMVREVEPNETSVRLELLRIRALKCGHTADIVTENGPVLSITVFDAKRIVGFINVWPEETEERWSLNVHVDALAGLPMQADVLVENAKLVRDAFVAVTQS
jgi:hypothetical protein